MSLFGWTIRVVWHGCSLNQCTFKILVIQFLSLIFYSSHTESNPEDTYSTLQSVRQQIFVKHEFHYLHVSRVGTFTVYDIFDCTFECLSNPSCLSVNMAAYKGANGELWCELLSSDKYRNSTEYEENKSSHHFSIKV